MSKNISANFIYGIHAVRARLAARPKTIAVIYFARLANDAKQKEILSLAARYGIISTQRTNADLSRLAKVNSHQGLVAEIKSDHDSAGFEESDLEPFLNNLQKPPFILVLDGVQDPHNLGACLRTADAAGVDAVIVPRDKAAGITPIVCKVACGAIETVKFFSVTNLARTLAMLKERGIWLYGTDALATQTIYEIEFAPNVAIVLGAEGSGLRRLTRDSCDFLISIPMCGAVQSLNVSVATGVCLYEVLRQRGFKP